MKRSLFVISLLLCALCVKAQILVDWDQITRHQNTTLRANIYDSKSKEPIPYASIYLTPQGDTTITYFSLSNEKGHVEIKDIIPGKYEVNAEMIGYKPYKKIEDIKGWEKELGGIELEEDAELLAAASISAVGNAVTVDGDTLIYNASSFRVGENSMLEDLLRRMPGMEVASDGTVKVNGEKVDKITVGGRTFFFNDPSMAVKNLPAKVVDKIKVMDKKKDEAEFSGVSTKSDKEKVMDIQLKEEYKKGWFGNLKAAGGATLGSNDDDLAPKRMAVYNTNAMVAGYNDTDQLTVIAGARNAPEPGSRMVFAYFGDGEMDEFDTKMGQIASAQAGVNYNTERVKGFETDASFNFNYSHKDAREETVRTSLDGGTDKLVTSGSYRGDGYSRKYSANLGIEKKDKEKYLFSVNPTFSLSNNNRETSSISTTAKEGKDLNSSASRTASDGQTFNTRTYWRLGVKDLGKKRRSLTFSGNFSVRSTKGSSSEMSETTAAGTSDIRNLYYDKRGSYLGTEGVISYVEPFGEKWSLETRFTASWQNSDDNRDAFDAKGGPHNDYYTSFSRNKNLLFRERLLAQYAINDKDAVVFGVQLDEENNRIHSKSLGQEKTVGEGNWVFNWAPYAEVNIHKDNTRYSISAGGRSSNPTGMMIMPSLDISNPVYTSVGNIYLKPSFSQYIYGGAEINNPKRFSFFSIYANAQIKSNNIVEASWFDAGGIRYSIPVNSKKPSYDLSLYLNYRVPLNKEKTLTLSLEPMLQMKGSTVYQATRSLPGLDKDNFDYAATMASLWGNKDGDLFYGGKSGFAAQSTRELIPYFNMELSYQTDNWTLTAQGLAYNTTSFINSKKTSSTWEIDINPQVKWRGGKGWEIMTDIDFNFLRGYAEAYNRDQYIWNAKVSKNIKNFTLSLGMDDIFDQGRFIYHINKAEYSEDQRNNMAPGRYIMLGLTWNFGKMNAKNNQKMQSAMWQMMY